MKVYDMLEVPAMSAAMKSWGLTAFLSDNSIIVTDSQTGKSRVFVEIK